MKPRKIMRGSVPPLFNRIVGDESNQGIDSKLLSEQELEESIIMSFLFYSIQDAP